MGGMPAGIKELPFPMDHLGRLDGGVGDDLLDSLPATDGLRGEADLGLRTVSAGLLISGKPDKGR